MSQDTENKGPQKVQPNPTNKESSGAGNVGVANSGQNEFPLKKEAREAAEENAKSNGLPSAGSQASAGARHVNTGEQDADDLPENSNQ